MPSSFSERIRNTIDPPRYSWMDDSINETRRNRGGKKQKPTKELKDSIISSNVIKILMGSKADIVRKDGKIRIFIKDPDNNMFNEIAYRVHQEKHQRPQNNHFNAYHNNNTHEQNYELNTLNQLADYLLDERGYNDLNTNTLIQLIQNPDSKWYNENDKYIQFNPEHEKFIEYDRNGVLLDSFSIN